MKRKFKCTYYDTIPYDILKEYDLQRIEYKIKLFNKTRSDCYVEVSDEKLEENYNSIPSYASYVTSYARIEILKALLKCQFNELVYCDTDSVFIEIDDNVKDLLKLGNELGQFKLEDKRILEIRGLKNYTFEKNGQIIDGIKGIPRTAIKISSNQYKLERYYKTKQAIRQNKETGDNYFMIKTISHKYDKRIVKLEGKTETIKLNHHE